MDLARLISRLGLSHRLYVMLAIAALPLCAVVGLLVWQEQRDTRALSVAFETYDLASQQHVQYRLFLNGVADAVDSGSVGKTAIEALSKARDADDRLATLRGAPLAASTDLKGIQAALAKDTTLTAVMPLREAIRTVDLALGESTDAAQKALTGFVRQRADSVAVHGLWIGATAITSMGLAIIFGLVVIRGITRPLESAIKVANNIAAGNLDNHVESHTDDEVGRLMQALAVMNRNLGDLATRVRSSSDAISTSATQIAKGNGDLAKRTAEQASGLMTTASSMEEITSTVKQNASNAKTGNQLAVHAKDIATHGGAVVDEMVVMMNSIQDSSHKIVDIISVINEISFQTNLLALNAAVEAARAGDQGRGFAVVASEVRALAQRSATAAQEIRVLIEDSTRKVAEGGDLAAQVGKTTVEVTAAVNKVADIMTEISAASAEQSAGIDLMNRAVTQLDAVTQRNAAMVEEAAAAAELLEDEARTLMSSVSAFKVSALTDSSPRGSSAPEDLDDFESGRLAAA